MQELVTRVATELNLKEYQVSNTLKLMFEEECTIPFIARYRKEMTGSLDEVQLRDIRDRSLYLQDLESTRTKYLKVIEEHCSKSPELMAKFQELRVKLLSSQTKQELEDLYLPFKPKRRTRGQIAREKGLNALLEELLKNRADCSDLEPIAAKYVTPEGADVEVGLKVNSVKEALAGAADILAEQINETAEFRAVVRELSYETGAIVSKQADNAESNPPEDDTRGKGKKNKVGKYENYYDYRESLKTAPSHRIMAVRRGDAERVLRMAIDVDEALIVERLTKLAVGETATSHEMAQWIGKVAEDAYKRLIGPSIETELRLLLKNRAETEAIKVFSDNLEKLLLLPPIPGKVVLGVDPGLRTGSKFAVVSETGKFLTAATVYPDYNKEESPKSKDAATTIARLIREYAVQYVAIGNGTGSKEIDRFISAVIRKEGISNIKRLVVNEAGASVYSTDPIARSEFPDLDPTIRSAISIARRLQDPLAELVKIDPRSIGVGQYQHDVNVTKLKSSLEEVVESCVNKVGVNLNTASHKLLGYVSGIGQVLSRSIVDYRNAQGPFQSRLDVMSVAGFGPKAFEQAAGFLRVPESQNLLDNSGVHPERYPIVETVANDLKMPLSDFVGKKELIENIPWEKYVTAQVGMPTLIDISRELLKPGRDPREDGARLIFSDDISDLEDLKPGQILKGTVTNVTNFGAFVDIGVHQDGLIHVSELSDSFITDPFSVVSVGDILDVRVLDVDMQRRRISLSRKKESSPPAVRANGPSQKPGITGQQVPGGSGSHQPRRNPNQGAPQQGSRMPNRGAPNGSGSPRPSGGGRPPHRHAGQHQDNRGSGRAPQNQGAGNNQQAPRPHQNRPPKPQRPQQPAYSMNDLLEKFKRN